jgi:hypothetical protein
MWMLHNHQSDIVFHIEKTTISRGALSPPHLPANPSVLKTINANELIWQLRNSRDCFKVAKSVCRLPK